MSAVSDLLILGAVGAAGLYLYQTNTKVKDAADIVIDTGKATLIPQASSKENFNKIVNQTQENLEDLTGADIPDLPPTVTNVVKKTLENPITPVTSLVADYAAEQITKEDPIKTVLKATGYNSNPATLITNTITDLVTGNFKWTGFHF